ncbi:MAG: hypothetical protein AB8H79_15050 [Myxococcota bacterium]
MSQRTALTLTLGVLALVPSVANAGYTASFGTTEVSIEPVTSSGTVSDYYGYNTTNTAASDTLDGLEKDNVGVFFLHEDGSGDISVVTLLDQFGSTDSGKVNIAYSGALGSTLAVMDDPRSVDARDVAGTTTDGWDIKWTFSAGQSDGAALTVGTGAFCVGIDVVRSFGLTSYEIVSPDGSGGFTRTSVPSGDWDDIELCSVPDSDGDGVADADDDCPSTPSGVTVDADGCPIDTDDDGVSDDMDDCPSTPSGVTVDADGCPVDADGDGVSDDVDDCLGTASGEVIDASGCSIADYCPCNDPWSSKYAYLSCVYDEGRVFYSDGLISRSEFRWTFWGAVFSTCGSSCR